MWRTLFLLLLLCSALAKAGDGFVLDLNTISLPLEQILEQVEIAHRLGASHFNVPVLFCQNDFHANEVYWCDDSIAREPLTADAESKYKSRVEILGNELKTRGYTVAYSPLVLSKDKVWRGAFEPTDFKSWSQSYFSHLSELADIALRVGVSEFIVGSELDTLYFSENLVGRTLRELFWRNTLTTLRTRLNSGSTKIPVLLVANWNQWNQIPFWDASDYIGLSAYFPLADADPDSVTQNPSVEELTSRWQEWATKLTTLSHQQQRPLYFAEVGYNSMKSAAHEPWQFSPLTDLDLELQARLFTAFENVWVRVSNQSLFRFTLWSLSTVADPLHDYGYTVIGKPAESVVSSIFGRRNLFEKLRQGQSPLLPSSLPVLFTLDDIPMWAVTDVDERLKNYDTLRQTLLKHHVPAVVFVNAGLLEDPKEWDALQKWIGSGFQLANHTATHIPRSSTSEDAFLADLDEDTSLLDHFLPKWPKWDEPARFFRYPNLDFGPDPTTTCDAIRARGFEIMPVSLDSRDWSMAMDYSKLAAPDLEDRPELGVPAQALASKELALIDQQVEKARGNHEILDQGSALIMLIHSTRFTRDYLDHILTHMELQGVHWVSPDSNALKAYHPSALPSGQCVPACIASKACF